MVGIQSNSLYPHPGTLHVPSRSEMCFATHAEQYMGLKFSNYSKNTTIFLLKNATMKGTFPNGVVAPRGSILRIPIQLSHISTQTFYVPWPQVLFENFIKLLIKSEA